MNKNLIYTVIIFTICALTALALYKITTPVEPYQHVPVMNHGKHQTIFIDQAKHNSIQFDDSNSVKTQENSDNFVVTIPYSGEGEIYELDVARMQCDDLAKWWNSHNNGNNDEIWSEISKLGCQ